MGPGFLCAFCISNRKFQSFLCFTGNFSHFLTGNSSHFLTGNFQAKNFQRKPNSHNLNSYRHKFMPTSWQYVIQYHRIVQLLPCPQPQVCDHLLLHLSNLAFLLLLVLFQVCHLLLQLLQQARCWDIPVHLFRWCCRICCRGGWLWSWHRVCLDFYRYQFFALPKEKKTTGSFDMQCLWPKCLRGQLYSHCVFYKW